MITGTILSIKTFHNPKIKVSLYTAIPKGERFDWLIEKSSEIGIYKLIPTIYSRSVVNDISINKLERYKKISLSASSQCSRADIMNIEQPTSFFSILDLLIKQKNTLNILPWECEEKNSIPKLLNNIENIENINIFIGPEGGFDNNEIEFALKNNFKTITLGKNILRVETAAIVASSIVLSNIGF